MVPSLYLLLRKEPVRPFQVREIYLTHYKEAGDQIQWDRFNFHLRSFKFSLLPHLPALKAAVSER